MHDWNKAHRQGMIDRAMGRAQDNTHAKGSMNYSSYEEGWREADTKIALGVKVDALKLVKEADRIAKKPYTDYSKYIRAAEQYKELAIAAYRNEDRETAALYLGKIVGINEVFIDVASLNDRNKLAKIENAARVDMDQTPTAEVIKI